MMSSSWTSSFPETAKGRQIGFRLQSEQLTAKGELCAQGEFFGMYLSQLLSGLGVDVKKTGYTASICYVCMCLKPIAPVGGMNI